jgi:hypothetical protein
VLKLKKSLYGLRQDPKTFYDKLRFGLLERGWQQSKIDPFLFMKPGMICVVYVDDTIIGALDTTRKIERKEYLSNTDISHLLLFYWFEPVLYLDPVARR